MMIALLITTIFAAPDSAAIKETIKTYNQHSQFKIPQLSGVQRKKLLQGDVIKIVDKGKDAEGNTIEKNVIEPCMTFKMP